MKKWFKAWLNEYGDWLGLALFLLTVAIFIRVYSALMG